MHKCVYFIIFKKSLFKIHKNIFYNYIPFITFFTSILKFIAAVKMHNFQIFKVYETLPIKTKEFLQTQNPTKSIISNLLISYTLN